MYLDESLSAIAGQLALAELRKPEGTPLFSTETLTNLLVKCHNNMDLAKVYKQQTVLPMRWWHDFHRRPSVHVQRRQSPRAQQSSRQASSTVCIQTGCQQRDLLAYQQACCSPSIPRPPRRSSRPGQFSGMQAQHNRSAYEPVFLAPRPGYVLCQGSFVVTPCKS